ncbi:MAG: M28 family peptidase [Fuerstiella sp.]
MMISQFVKRCPWSELRFCLLLFVVFANTGQAQEATELSNQQQTAISSITKAKLQGTVSFLASDEMKGRMTPSPELAIASRYVATRLQAAGLSPLSKDESYFQVQTWPQVMLPAAARLSVAGKPVKVLGILSAASSDVTLKGTLLTEGNALKVTETKDSQQDLCVVLDGLPLPPIGQVSPNMLQSFLARRLIPLKRKNVALVIVKCDSGSSLPELARTLQGVSMSAMEGRNANLPVLLVASDDVSEEASVEAEVPAALDSTASVRNVFGVVRGSDPQLSKTAIIVTAHLDHIGTRQFGPDRINNGADDNATGVAAVLAMAEAVAAMPEPPKRSIIFGTFWGEESGLLGSKAYAKDPLWPLDQTIANVNFEMLGRPEADAKGKVWMTGWKHSNLGEIMNQGSLRAGVEVFNRTDVGEMLYTRSDNYSFVQKGVIAHSFSAGSLHSDYHQPTDEWEKLDFDHMTKVSQGLLSGLLHLANQTEAPAKP